MKKYVKSSSDEEYVESLIPPTGQGNSKASQIAVAVNRLEYKWWNDGDVYDNRWPNGEYVDYTNDVSSFANWLYRYSNDAGVQDILMDVRDCNSESDYDRIMSDLVEYTMNQDFLSRYADVPAEASVYECSGPFEVDESWQLEDEEW